MEIVGVDHVYLAVSDFGRSSAFYDRVMASPASRRYSLAFPGY
jgi:hypothetical protein